MKYELYSCQTPDQITKDSDMEVYDPEEDQDPKYREGVGRIMTDTLLTTEQRVKMLDEYAVHAAWAWAYKLVFRVNDDGSRTVIMQNDRRIT